MVRRFEEISNNAWPALQTMHYDGWILRFANGVTKRSNSVNLLYPSHLDPEEKITFCERIYAAQQIIPCFKITGIADPSDLDERLASRGYYIHSTISFQTLTISDSPAEPRPDVIIETELQPRWMDEFIRMNEFDVSRKPTYIDIMNQLHLPKCLISVADNKRTIGVGLGVAEGNYVGIFDIVVDKNCRNRGLGHLIVDNILHWGIQQGARKAYLQVLTNNMAANMLYEKMGFKEEYRYWYRMK
jgi:GNAT superfamily N-acetyltransferase